MTSPDSSASGFREANLAFLHQETLTSIVRLRSGRQEAADATYFRNQIRKALMTAQDEARAAGYSDQAIHDSQFALVSFLDETIAELRAPITAEWMKKPLLEEFAGLKTGVESFLLNLERLMAQPDSAELGDTLEVYLLCLMLGYADATESEPLSALRNPALARLRDIRGWTPEFSSSWRPPEETQAGRAANFTGNILPIAAVACLLGLSLSFAAYRIILNNGVGELRSMTSVGGAP